MSETDARTEWVRRVLGVELRATSPHATPASVASTLRIWQDARDLVDEQIGKLQGALRNSGLPLFQRIADQGLNGFTQTRLVGMQVALMEFDSALGEARDKAAGKARAAMQAMRSFLQSSPIPRLLDENRLGVAMSLRDSLTAALDQIERNLPT